MINRHAHFDVILTKFDHFHAQSFGQCSFHKLVNITDINIFVVDHFRNLTTKKTIYLIRHGQTDYNLQGIIQGRGIDSDLNETGRSQAEAFYQHYKHIEFDRVYTSQLKRTKQSVAGFTEMGIETVEHRGLDEINWGIYEGQKATNEHRVMFQSITQKWREGDVHFAPDGGESPFDLQKRQREALEHLRQADDEQTILICMHGRALRSFLCLMLDHPLHLMDDFPHTNLCLYRLAMKSDFQINLLEKNSTLHLNDRIRSNFP